MCRWRAATVQQVPVQTVACWRRATVRGRCTQAALMRCDMPSRATRLDTPVRAEGRPALLEARGVKAETGGLKAAKPTLRSAACVPLVEVKARAADCGAAVARHHTVLSLTLGCRRWFVHQWRRLHGQAAACPWHPIVYRCWSMGYSAFEAGAVAPPSNFAAPASSNRDKSVQNVPSPAKNIRIDSGWKFSANV